jgi:predicted small lipoprotein YifL
MNRPLTLPSRSLFSGRASRGPVGGGSLPLPAFGEGAGVRGGRSAALAFLVVLLPVMLAGCGKKNPPQPPPGVPNTYPRAYPSA